MIPYRSNGDMTLMPGEIKRLRSLSKPGVFLYINTDHLDEHDPFFNRCFEEGLIEFSFDDEAEEITNKSQVNTATLPKGTYKKVLLTEHGKVVVNYATERGNTKPVHLSDIFCQ